MTNFELDEKKEAHSLRKGHIASAHSVRNYPEFHHSRKVACAILVKVSVTKINACPTRSVRIGIIRLRTGYFHYKKT